MKKLELPIYFPYKNIEKGKLYLAIWNCGTRPQTFWQKIRDTRITIRRSGNCVFVIKKGDY